LRLEVLNLNREVLQRDHIILEKDKIIKDLRDKVEYLEISN